MSKPSHREKLLTEGLKVVHARGFAGAGVRDIVRAAGVPQGSFTNHFASKEAFGLEVIDLYYANSRKTIQETLRNETLSPLARLTAWFDAHRARIEKNEMRRGCLFGNFTAEASDHSEAIREKLAGIFGEIEQAVADCLRAAVKAGEAPAKLDCDDLAAFIVTSLQGANLLARAQRSTAPVERLKRVVLERLLK